MLPILMQSCIYKGQNALKNWWQQTTKSIFTDIKKVDSTIPFIKKNLFFTGLLYPKTVKTRHFYVKTENSRLYITVDSSHSTIVQLLYKSVCYVEHIEIKCFKCRTLNNRSVLGSISCTAITILCAKGAQ